MNRIQVPPQIVNFGNGADMTSLARHSADLVFTSPPYFSDETYTALKSNSVDPTGYKDIEKDILKFARNLRPVFSEIGRVLKKSHPLIIQTKDIRCSGFLVPLSEAHLSIARTCGFHLVARIHWTPSKFNARRIPTFLKTKRVGDFRPFESEQFLVLSDASGLSRRGRVNLNGVELRNAAQILWRDPFRKKKGDHPFASPRPIVKKLLSLFSEPNDLVVDPFAGFGTILEVAAEMGRNVSGWEISRDVCEEANRRLQQCKVRSL